MTKPTGLSGSTGPLLVQFGIYVSDVLQGDFGKSIRTGQEVSTDIARVFPATLELATLGTLIGVVIGRATRRHCGRAARQLD